MLLGSRRIGIVLVACLLAAGHAPGWAQEEATAPPRTDRDRVATGDRTVAAGESVDDIVVIGGDLRVIGEVRGDAVVVGGRLILEEGGTVLGDAVVTNGSIVDNGGRVGGEMRTVDAPGVAGAAADGGRRSASGTAARTISDQVDRAERRTTQAVRPRSSWFDPVRRGGAGLISTLALGIVLAGVGVGLVFFARPRLETVSDTARASAVRSGAVGLAAAFLVVPAFVVMVIALAISIVGIPLLLVAIPLYLLAVPAAFIFGLLASSHAIGERTIRQMDRADYRYHNAYAYVLLGLAMFLVPLAAGNLLVMTGFLSWLGSIVKFFAGATLWMAAIVGLGSLILTWAGSRPGFAAPLTDPGPLFEDEMSGRDVHA
jgi:hypothetical protein